MKSLLRELAPPALLRWWRRRHRPIRWSGDYPDWAAAYAHSGGYDEPANLERVVAATRQVLAGKAAFERDGMAFSTSQYSWPMLSLLLATAASEHGVLDVVDVGGALGSTYHQHRRLLAQVPEVRWRVVEQPAWVVAGRAEFETRQLTFHDSITEARRPERPQVLLLSSVLPYLSAPHAFLSEAVEFGFPAVLIDRTGVLTAPGRDRLTVQTVRPPLFFASYPCWFFDRSQLLAHFVGRYETVAEFESPDEAGVPASFRGFFLRSTK